MAKATIYVRFDKRGFYHPAFGVMGATDDDRGRVYELPEFFEKKGMLPKSAKIVDKKEHNEAVADGEEGVEPAVRPKNIDPEELKKAAAKASEQSAAEADAATEAAKTAKTAAK